MRRKEILALSGCKLTNFTAYRNRDQLPFLTDSAPSAPEVQAKHDQFTLDDAFRLRLMVDLVGGDGLAGSLRGVPPSEAGKIISNAMMRFDRHPLKTRVSAELYAGVIVFEEQSGAPVPLRYSVWFAGPIDDLPSVISGEDKGAGYPRKPVRIHIVNASEAARQVLKRAIELELPEAEYGPEEDWPK